MKPGRVRVNPEDQDDVYRAQIRPDRTRSARGHSTTKAWIDEMPAREQEAEPVYPDDYRACQVCKTPISTRCVSLSGRVVNGRPDGVRTELDHPHMARKMRTRRKR